MFPKRKHFSIFSLVGFPSAGLVIGAAVALLNPPRSPADYRWEPWILGGGLGAISLLFGVLAWLWLRGRVSVVGVLSAIAIPVCAFGSFANAKGGIWWAALYCGLAGSIALAAFFAQSLDLISGRDDNFRSD